MTDRGVHANQGARGPGGGISGFGTDRGEMYRDGLQRVTWYTGRIQEVAMEPMGSVAGEGFPDNEVIVMHSNAVPQKCGGTAAEDGITTIVDSVGEVSEALASLLPPAKERKHPLSMADISGMSQKASGAAACTGGSAQHQAHMAYQTVVYSDRWHVPCATWTTGAGTRSPWNPSALARRIQLGLLPQSLWLEFLVLGDYSTTLGHHRVTWKSQLDCN